MLLDNKSRALVRRHGPYEVEGAYKWADQIINILEKPDGPKFERSKMVGLAELAAEVREQVPERLGTLLRKKNVSKKHVRRLLASDYSNVVDQLSNIVRITKRQANVFDLVCNAYFWGDSIKRKIAIDYFGSVQNDNTDQEQVDSNDSVNAEVHA